MKKILKLIAVAAAMVCCLTACGGDSAPAKAKEVELNNVMSGFTLSDGLMTLDVSDLLDAYGIAEADVKQFAAVQSTGLECDEIVLIEAVDAAAAERVKNALENRYQAKVNQTIDYQPDQYAIIKDCSVTVDGNYVAMIVAPNAAELVKSYNEAIK